jgi:O-antigen/teichoic acid export membrane protein
MEQRLQAFSCIAMCMGLKTILFMGIIARQSIKGTIVTYLGVAIGFITTFFVLTRFLSAEEIGLARVLVDAATLFIGLAQLGTSSSIIRFYPYFKDKEQGDHGFFFWTLCVPFIGFLLFSLIYWACSVPLCQWFSEKSPLFVDYYYMVLPIAFFMLYQTIFETNANVLMRIVVPRAVREVFVRIGMLVIYLLYAFRILSMDGFVIAISLVYALATLINIVYLWYEGRISLRVDWAFLRANKQVVRNYLLYTAFLVISAVAAVLAPTLSSFFITAKMGLNYTGIFAIATYISVMVSIPYRSVTAIASPQLSQTIKDKDTQGTSMLMKQCSNNLLLIGGFILVCRTFICSVIPYLQTTHGACRFT